MLYQKTQVLQGPREGKKWGTAGMAGGRCGNKEVPRMVKLDLSLQNFWQGEVFVVVFKDGLCMGNLKQLPGSQNTYDSTSSRPFKESIMEQTNFSPLCGSDLFRVHPVDGAIAVPERKFSFHTDLAYRSRPLSTRMGCLTFIPFGPGQQARQQPRGTQWREHGLWHWLNLS